MMRLALQRIDKEPDNTFGNDQAKLLFRKAILNPNISIVIGGGDSAAILNKIGGSELKKMIKLI